MVITIRESNYAEMAPLPAEAELVKCLCLGEEGVLRGQCAQVRDRTRGRDGACNSGHTSSFLRNKVV